jgi:predicted regulator of Ras-like GTPase activity (Roadblock/LC7/MglB family)
MYVDDSAVVVDEAGPEPVVEADPGSGEEKSGRMLRLPHGAPASAPEVASPGVHVPLAPIIAGLPLELQSRVQHEVGDLSVFLSLDRIMPQLAKGVVSISFGELRSVAPRVFSANRDQDAVAVNVPLSAILPQISPEMLARRHGPLHLDIPDDIVSPFANKGKGLAVGVVAPLSPAPVAAHPSPSPVVSRRLPVAAAPSQPSNPVPVSQPRRPAIPRPNVPASSAPSVPTPAVPRPTMPRPVAISARTGAPHPVPGSGPAVGKTPVTENGTRILGRSSVAPLVPVHPPAAHSASASGEASAHGPLTVALSAVADAWSDSLKQEIIQLDLAEASVALPFAAVEAGLKRGRLSFPWKKLKAWVHPSLQAQVSVHDPVELELPLRVIAPLFIAQRREQPQTAGKVAVDRDIPNLFFGLPQPDTAGLAVDHAVNKPVDTNYYVWDDQVDAVPDDARNNAASCPRTAGTEFVTRYATPNEVVSRASALEGVEGAVIALPDGLMVASHLPPGLNGDTLAAFLPHLFGKVSQCTQELRMGEVNNLNFTVGNVPWKIFRVNALYFAAFGRKGQALPTARLASLAGELDHKAKA